MNKNERIIVFPKNKLASFILNSSLPRLIITILIFLIFAFIPLFIAIFEGNFINAEIDLDAVHDYGYFIQFGIGFPLVLVLIYKYFSTFKKTINTLLKSDVFEMGSSEKMEIIKKINDRFALKTINIIPVIVAALITILGLFSYILSDSVTWNNFSGILPVSFAGIVILFVVFILYYLAATVLCSVFIVYLTIKDLFSNKMNIQPLHPDGCGGLSSLGELSKSLNLSIIILGVLCFSGIYAGINMQGLPVFHYSNIFIVIVYLVVAVAVFFLPLRPAAKKMADSKNDTLNIINSGFNNLNSKILEDMKNEKEISQERLKAVKSYTEFYSIAEKMPVYPYDVKTLRSFGTSFMLPVILFALEYLFTNIITF